MDEAPRSTLFIDPAKKVPVVPTNPPPLRLSILHLFFFMTGTGLALLPARVFGNSESLPHFVFVYFILTALCDGAALASIGVWIERKLRGERGFPSQPGHWALLALGLAAVVSLGMWLVVLLFRDSWIFYTNFGLADLACAICLAIGATRIQPGGWRRATFCSAVVCGVIGVIHFLFGSLFLIGTPGPGALSELLEFLMGLAQIAAAVGQFLLIPILAIWGAVLAYIERSRPRDLWHYLGAWLPLAKILIYLFAVLVSMVIPYFWVE